MELKCVSTSVCMCTDIEVMRIFLCGFMLYETHWTSSLQEPFCFSPLKEAHFSQGFRPKRTTISCFLWQKMYIPSHCWITTHPTIHLYSILLVRFCFSILETPGDRHPLGCTALLTCECNSLLHWQSNRMNQNFHVHSIWGPILPNGFPRDMYRHTSEILWVCFQTTSIKQLLQDGESQNLFWFPSAYKSNVYTIL